MSKKLTAVEEAVRTFDLRYSTSPFPSMHTRLHALEEPAERIDSGTLRQGAQVIERSGGVPQDGLTRIVEHAEVVHMSPRARDLPGGQPAVVEDLSKPVVLGILRPFENG